MNSISLSLSKNAATKSNHFLFEIFFSKSGEYQINVKWSGKHVPHSPFNVIIFKTKEEMDNYVVKNPQEAGRFKCQEKQTNGEQTSAAAAASTQQSQQPQQQQQQQQPSLVQRI
jgi:hypothetical protein